MQNHAKLIKDSAQRFERFEHYDLGLGSNLYFYIKSNYIDFNDALN